MNWPRLPFTLTPLPGESFDSWFEAYAARLQILTGDLAAAIGLPQPYLRTPIGTLLTRGITPSHLPRLAATTGLNLASLDELFHRPGPTPTTGRATVTRAISHAWAPAAGTRFCPACLTTTGGRFLLAWRLPWTFFCLSHDRPLAEGCPQCQQPPRARHITVMRRPDPGRCCTPAGQTRRTQSPCGADLTTAIPSGDLDLGEARHAQLFINTQVANATGGCQDGLNALIDLTVIAHNLTNPGTVGKRHVRGHMLHAATLTGAVGLLTHNGSDPHDDPLAVFVQRHAQGPRRTPAIPESWRPASPATTARIAYGRDAYLSATERVRYATTLPTPSSHRRSSTDLAVQRAGKVPDQIWSAWAVRLTNDDRNDPVRLRPAAAVALLLPHSALKLPKAAALLSPHLRGDAVEHQLTMLGKATNGPIALRILSQLGMALDTHNVPIDYARRRRLVADIELIDAVTWKQLTNRSHYFKGGRRRLRFARCHLYELLTGGAPSIAPPPYTLPTQIRAEYHEFVLGLPAPLVDALHEHARALLVRSGSADEPLQWEPPTDWVNVDTWPGADPDLTEAASLHSALQAGDAASRVAVQHGLSMEHLRHVIRRHPLPARDEPVPKAGAIRPNETNTDSYRHVAGAHYINLAWLREQYITWQRSIADIADDIGCNRRSLTAFAKQHGIPMRPRGGGSTFIAPKAAPTHPARLPSPLRAALTGQDARSRIDRFLLIARHGTIRKAAAEAGKSDTTLRKQLTNLETRCGGTLIDRRPHRLGDLTGLGKTLIQQATEHLRL